MKAFTQCAGIVAALDRANVDTDQIIPKQFLKSIKRTGFGEALFFDWRYLADGSPDPAFELNDPAWKGANILVTRNNFGCGSSREHAVWAVMQYGFEVVIAPRVERDGAVIPAFADIFRNNAVGNGLLTVELAEQEVDELLRAAVADKGLKATVDLPAQTVTLHGDPERIYRFEIDPGVKERFLKGLDAVGLTLELQDEIERFESAHDTQLDARGA